MVDEMDLKNGFKQYDRVSSLPDAANSLSLEVQKYVRYIPQHNFYTSTEEAVPEGRRPA